MSRRRLSPIVVWTLLVLATLLSYASWLDARWGDIRLTGSAVVAIALAKVWLIGMRYMEIDEAIWPLRLAFNAWVLVVGAVLLVMLWQA